MARIIFLFFFVCLSSLSSTKGQATIEARYLHEKFAEWVGGIHLTERYKEIVFAQVRAFLSSSKAIDCPQYLLFVDRNPDIQLATLFFVEPPDNLIIIGADKISTGNPARKGYFVTPLGLVKNSPENMSYRALGTKNRKGWRGLGVKGSRVWDFGWVETQTKKGEPYKIRLLAHATDPDQGETRLGKIDSKGCIRISGRLNYFLDYFGILDAEYEKRKEVQYVLLPEREPVSFSGRFVFVGDSEKKSENR